MRKLILQNKIPVYFYRLRLIRLTVLRGWIASMKRKNPPVNKPAKVCSNHFVDDDYVEDGKLATQTKQLKHDLVRQLLTSLPTRQE